MRTLRAWLLRFGSLFNKQRRDRELAAELESHLQMHIEDNLRAGMTPEEARRQALIKLGGVEQTKENYRDRRGLPWLESLLQDVRFGLRMLRKNTSFTAVAVLTLALGIGANTAIFSLLNALVLRDLNVSHPGQLVEVGTVDSYNRPEGLSIPSFEAIERNQTVFSTMFAWSGNLESRINLETNGTLSLGDILGVTGDYYSTLGVSPLLGRLIGPADVHLEGGTPENVVVLGYDFWRRRFGADPSAIGKTVRIEGAPFTVIGVTRPGFTGMRVSSEDAVTIPLTAQGAVSPGMKGLLANGAVLWVNVTGRLKNGMTMEQARAQLESLWPGIRAATDLTGASERTRAFFLTSRIDVQSVAKGSHENLRSEYAQPLVVLMAIAGLVLLITCVNLASLTLSRASARSYEMGVRAALGAGLWRLIRQVITENLMLSFAGATIGVLFANWGSRLVLDFITQNFFVPSVLDVSPDLRVFAFTAAAAVATGILFSIVPAWRAGREDPGGALQQNPRATGRVGAAAKLLIITQVALSVVLVMGAALFVRSLQKLRAVDLGFQKEGVILSGLYGMPHGYQKMNPDSYYPQLMQRIKSLPGVTAASFAKNAPYSPLQWKQTLSPYPAVEGSAKSLRATWAVTSPDFFGTLGVRLLEGRDFRWDDNDRSPNVAILSKSAAQKIFPGESAIGRIVRVSDDPKDPPAQVVGIVGDTRVYGNHQTEVPTVYVPYLQESFGYPDVLIRTNLSPESIGPAVRNEIEAFGFEYPIQFKTLARVEDQSLLTERIIAILSGFFGALALLLAAVGLFGIASYSVTRRVREIGIRVALGAQRSAVLWMVHRENLLLVIAGLAVGVPCALAATRLIEHMLFALSATDPAVLVTVIGTLLTVGAAASYLPAWRASRVDLMVALRHE